MRNVLLTGFALVFGLVFSVSLYAQGGFGGGMHPDSLEMTTVDGIAIVDTSTINTLYFLDENGDGTVDYFLQFPRMILQPDSVMALLPSDGDSVTVTGVVLSTVNDSLDVMVVFEINGETWLDPFIPAWNNYSWNHNHQNNWGEDNDCGFHGFGFLQDSLEFIETSGIVSVDTTFAYPLYFLDVNADDSVDYFLNFGPPWYEPESDLTRPEDGTSITVSGGLITHDSSFSVIIVSELNGEVWRDSSAIGRQFGGDWITEGATDSVRVHSPFDQEDWLDVGPGWHGGGHGNGGMMFDSLFMQISEVFPWNVPGLHDTIPVAGYEVSGYTPRGRNGMYMGNFGCGGHFQFGNQTRFQFHYTDSQINAASGLGKVSQTVNENDLVVKAWDDETDAWITVTDAIVDPTTNTVSFTSENVSSNYIITTSGSSTGNDPDQSVIDQYSLAQNYPNPFNPTTTIEYSLAADAKVSLSIYDVTGRLIRTLGNTQQSSGTHFVVWDSRNNTGELVSSGVYFYKIAIQSNGTQKTMMKKMVLMR